MFRHSFVPGLASALLAAVATIVHAAPPLTLDDALRLAAARSGLLAAQDASVASIKQRALAAGQLPDPVLKLGVDNLPVNGADRFSLTRDFMTMRRIGVMQELTSADKRSLRGAVLTQEAARQQAQRQIALAQLQRDTANAWLDLSYGLRLRELLVRQQQETRLQIEAAESAYRTGKGNQADVFAARSAVFTLDDRISQADRQIRGARLLLTRWTGAAPDQSLAGDAPWRASEMEDATKYGHLQDHPQVVMANAQVLAAEADVRLAQAAKSADWTVEASYAQRGPAFSNMVSIGVSIPLQLDQANRQDRELASKQALASEARARFDEEVRAHEVEIGSLINDWKSGKERIDRYAAQLLPVAAQRSEAALTTWRTGKSDLASVLAARRDELDMRIQALTLELETARAWAQLNFLIPDKTLGTQPKETP
jgi:outer membrane protein TolC